MTDEDFLRLERKAKAALFRTEVALKHLHGVLHEIRAEVANDRGMDVTVMSGGDADEKDPPPVKP